MKGHQLHLTRNVLYQRCLLLSLAYLIKKSQQVELNHEIDFDEEHFLIKKPNGSIGNILFYDHFCMGVFYNINKKSLSDEQLVLYFKGITKDLTDLAKQETLAYLLEPIKTQDHPVTTFLWSVRDELYSKDSMKNFHKQSDDLLKHYLLDQDDVLKHLLADYQLSPSEMKWILKLYHLKLNHPHQEISIDSKEIYLEHVDLSNVIEALKALHIIVKD